MRIRLFWRSVPSNGWPTPGCRPCEAAVSNMLAWDGAAEGPRPGDRVCRAGRMRRGFRAQLFTHQSRCTPGPGFCTKSYSSGFLRRTAHNLGHEVAWSSANKRRRSAMSVVPANSLFESHHGLSAQCRETFSRGKKTIARQHANRWKVQRSIWNVHFSVCLITPYWLGSHRVSTSAVVYVLSSGKVSRCRPTGTLPSDNNETIHEKAKPAAGRSEKCSADYCG